MPMKTDTHPHTCRCLKRTIGANFPRHTPCIKHDRCQPNVSHTHILTPTCTLGNDLWHTLCRVQFNRANHIHLHRHTLPHIHTRLNTLTHIPSPNGAKPLTERNSGGYMNQFDVRQCCDDMALALQPVVAKYRHLMDQATLDQLGGRHDHGIRGALPPD